MGAADQTRPLAASHQDSTALVIDCVSKRFGKSGNDVLDTVSLEVAKSEFLAIVGPSGCGKTTLLRIIQGLDYCTSGSVVAGGGTSPRMSYVFQNASLLPWYTVRDNVAFGLSLRAGRNIYPTRREADEAVDGLLELTGLAQYAHFYPEQISGGMQQRVNVARALAVCPDVLLLDEPFSALDALTRERLQMDVTSILAELGTTAILVTHDIREAVFMSDRIALMTSHPGRINDVFEVEFERPRSAEFQHSEELARLERMVWGKLRVLMGLDTH